MISEKIMTQKSQQSISAGFQYRTQKNSVILNPNINYTEITESVLLTEVTEISPPTSTTLIPYKKIPLQVLT